MRPFVTVLALGLFCAGSATASEHITDAAYLRMARCAGLTDGAGGDSSALNAALRSAGRGRSMQVRDRAMSRRREASLDMRSARGEERARLESEMAVRCALPPA